MNGEHQYSSFFPIFALYISAESPRVGKDMCIIYGEDVYKRLAFGFQNFAPFDLSKEQMATGNVLVVCIFTYCPFLSGERTCRIHIGVGFLRCSFLTGGHAKALELGTGKGKIPTPFLYTGSSYVGFNMSVGSPDE